MAQPPEGGGEGLVATIRPVTLGSEFPDGFEILSGLSEGEQVIVEGLMSQGARLRPGASVAIVTGDDHQVDGAQASPAPATGPGQAAPAAEAEQKVASDGGALSSGLSGNNGMPSEATSVGVD
jgi:hypothetical protein